MATLFDIAIATRKVAVGPVEIDVYGVSASTIVSILGRFPGIVDAYQKGSTDLIEILLQHGGEAMTAAVAAACGYPGDARAEKQAALLPADTQMTIVMEAIKITMPDGLDPFVNKLTALLGAFGLEAKSTSAADDFSNASALPSTVLSNGHDPRPASVQ